MPNIRDMDHYINSIWDWEPYNVCFSPTKIRITDLDGVIERHGRFIVLETKLPDVSIPLGQKILFDEIIKNPKWKVIVVWGETNNPILLQIWGNSKLYPINETKLQDIIRNWFELAEKRLPLFLDIEQDW